MSEQSKLNDIPVCVACNCNPCECIKSREKRVNTKETKITIPAFDPFKIYLLKRIFVAGYDEFRGKVIIASSAKAARKIANLKTGEEGKIWDNVNQVMCKEIMLTEAAIVLEDFNNG